jgi:bacillithiol system protein YtxJ
MAEIKVLDDMADWEDMWEEQKPEDAGALLVFKRSPVCPTSFTAEDRFKKFVSALPASKDLRIVSVDVIAARPVSRRIAELTGIRHESPQALLISRGQNVLWHASHLDITEDSLAEALSAAKV